jgi:hypothetical protein
MGKLRLTITMPLDGYVAGARQSAENPLGEGGIALHERGSRLAASAGLTVGRAVPRDSTTTVPAR